MPRKKPRPDDLVPELAFERFLNRKHCRVTFAVASTTVVYTQFATGMMLAEVARFKWVLYAITLQPRQYSTVPINAGAVDAMLHAEVRYGEQTALGYVDDVDTIASLDRQWCLTTSGMAVVDWPVMIPIVHPRPVLATNLTCLLRTASDDAAFQNKAYVFTFYYGISPASDADIFEEIKVRGSI